MKQNKKSFLVIDNRTTKREVWKMNEVMELHILPRKTMSWKEFLKKTPNNSIALDGVVMGGPNFDEQTLHINFDHHDEVVREATMSTSMQVFMAIKGGLMESFRKDGKPFANAYINDADQDTSFAVWLLCNYKLFEGVQSLPQINRLLYLTDKWDITGGGFPMNLNEKFVRQHCWVFEPYTNLRKSGKLYEADKDILRDNIESTMKRLSALMMGEASEKELDTRHTILYDSPLFKIVDEIGGNEARYYLFSNGINAFISLVARRSDGKFVWSVGRRSRYIPFPVKKLYDDFNKAEGFTSKNGWGGSDIIGGSSRELGSSLTWKQLAKITEKRLEIK